jgi:hypothetical protein
MPAVRTDDSGQHLTLQRLRRRNVQPGCVADALPPCGRINPRQQIAVEAHSHHDLSGTGNAVAVLPTTPFDVADRENHLCGQDDVYTASLQCKFCA